MAAVVAGVAGLIVLGMVSSRYFNVMMGREAFASEGVRDWLYWGAVSMVAPAVLVLMVLVGLSVVRLGVPPAAPGCGRVAAGWSTGCRPTLRRLGLDDIEFVSACALVASVAVLAGACWYSPVRFLALVGTRPQCVHGTDGDPCLSLAELRSRHTTYRFAFEWAGIIMVALWWVPFRLAARRGSA